MTLLLILHYSQGRDFVHNIIKHLPIGYIGVMIYSIYVGTVLSFIISTGYIVLIVVIGEVRKNIRVKREKCALKSV